MCGCTSKGRRQANVWFYRIPDGVWNGVLDVLRALSKPLFCNVCLCQSTSGKESIAYSYLLYLFSLFHFTQSLIKQSNYTKEKQSVESRASPKSIKFCVVMVRELKCYILRVKLATTCSYQKR